MFALAILKNSIRISPDNLGKNFTVQLIEQINKQFANYVIPNVGLCISFYDFIKIGASYILPGDPFTCTPVVFRCIVFQPFVNEILEGTICRSNRDGVTLSMQFFNDIIVLPDKLPVISKFDENEQTWYWEYALEDNQTAKFYMDAGKRVRFRIVSLHYENIEPGVITDSKAFSIKASMAETGLGCLEWWDKQSQNEESTMET